MSKLNNLRPKSSSSSISSSNKSQDAITVVIGKTFESTILPDGSQQITEVTKYKRLNDGFIYTERKLRQVAEDDKSEATSVHPQQQQQQLSRQDITPSTARNAQSFTPTPTRNSSNTNNNSIITPRNVVASLLSPRSSTRSGGFRLSLGSFRNESNQNTNNAEGDNHPHNDDINTKKLTNNSNGNHNNAGYPDLACPSSLTLTNSSSSDASTDIHVMEHVADYNHVISIDPNSTPNNGGASRRGGGGEDFVEEYFYNNSNNSSISSAHHHQKIQNNVEMLQHAAAFGSQTPTPRQRTNGSGWCANDQDQEDENSLQLVKDNKTRLWSSPLGCNPIKKLRLSDHHRVFHNHIGGNHGQDEDGFPRIIEHEDEEMMSGGNEGSGGSGTNHTSTKALRTPSSCCEKLRGRKYKILLAVFVAILAVTAVATIIYRTSTAEDVSTYSLDVSTPGAPRENSDKDTKGENDVQDTNTAEETSSTGSDDGEETNNDISIHETSTSSCISLKIILSTDENTGDKKGNQGDRNEWRLSRKEDDDTITTIASGGSLGPNEKHTIEDCLHPGLYTFHVSDSGGNGLGEGGNGGYYILSNGMKLGVSSFFFHEEEMTFELPFDGDEYDGDGDTACADDFFLAIKTDDKPQETYWNVVDNGSGDIVLEGGPYDLPWAVYTKRACLPNGEYTLNVKDGGEDGICCDNGQGFFVASSDGKTIVDSNGKYGDEYSTVFVLGSGSANSDEAHP